MSYRIGVRHGSLTVDFAAVYRTADTSFVIPGLDASTSYIVSAASIDSAGIMSPFGREWLKSNDAATAPAWWMTCLSASTVGASACPNNPR